MCWDISLHTDIEIIKKTFPQLRADRRRNMINVRSELFYLPGLYQWHETVDEDGVVERVGSFGMLTRAANEVMANIHNDGPNKHRMPLFLPEDLERQWIGDIQEEDMPLIFRFEMPNDKLKHYPVYTLRGYPNRSDGKHRYEAFDCEGLPPLGNDTVQTSLF